MVFYSNVSRPASVLEDPLFRLPAVANNAAMEANSELFERACRAHRDTAEILAEHHRLHVELVRLLERGRDLNYTAPILSDKPPPNAQRE